MTSNVLTGPGHHRLHEACDQSHAVTWDQRDPIWRAGKVLETFPNRYFFVFSLLFHFRFLSFFYFFIAFSFFYFVNNFQIIEHFSKFSFFLEIINISQIHEHFLICDFFKKLWIFFAILNIVYKIVNIFFNWWTFWVNDFF